MLLEKTKQKNIPVHFHLVLLDLNSHVCSSCNVSAVAIGYTKNNIKNKQNKYQYPNTPAKYINVFQIYRNTFSFIPCLCCVYLVDHMKYHVTQRIYHMKISCIPFVRCVKFRIIDQCNCTVIHEIPCNRNCQKKTGSTVRFPLDCLLQWCAYVFLIPMLIKVKDEYMTL